MTIHLTQHASERMQQRGAARDEVDLVAMAYDRKIYINAGLTVLSISREKAQKLRTVFGNSLVSKAAKIQLVVDYPAAVIVSVIKSANQYRPGQSRHRRGGGRTAVA